MKIGKLIISLFFILLPVLNFLTAEDSGDVDGTFQAIGYNNPVELTRFEVLDKDGLNVTSVLTPRERYLISFDVYDFDSIIDIKQIDIVFYYDKDDQRSFASILEEGTSLQGDEVVIRWQRDISNADSTQPELYDPTSPDSFEIIFDESIDGSLSTWKILNSTTPAILEAGTQTPTAFTFEFEIQISKVAPEDTNGAWRFGILIIDGAFPNYSDLATLSSPAIHVGPTGPLTESTSYFNMNFYGELSIPTDAAIIWQGVEPGMTYTHENALSVLENVKYLANGAYVHENSINAFWVISGAAADGTTLAALTADLFDGPQQFAVRAGMNVIGLAEPEDGIQMRQGEDGDTLAYAPIVLRDRSDENGHFYDFYYWLALSENFQNAQYSGLITAKVNNSVAVSGVSVVAFTGNIVNSLLDPSNSTSSPSQSSGLNNFQDNPPPVGTVGIYTWKDFWDIRNSWTGQQSFGLNKDYVLMNNLNAQSPDYEGYGDRFTVIRDSSGRGFEGSFDGNGYIIEDLVLINPNEQGVQSIAIFSYIDNAVIENFVLSGVSITGNLDNTGTSTTRYEVAVLASVMNKATLRNITISNVTVDIDSTVEITYVSGLIGWLNVFDTATIENVSLINANINCEGECRNVGGLFGRIRSEVDLNKLTLQDITMENVSVSTSGNSSNQVGLIYGSIRNETGAIVSNPDLENKVETAVTREGTNTP